MVIRKTLVASLLTLVASIIFFSTANADEVELRENPPRVELGAVAGFFYLPDYPGSNESRLRILPLPYLIYRGEIVRSEREGGIRGRFFRRENYELDLSFDAAFPVNSEKNKAREGMEDLDWIGEVGPRFIYHIFRKPFSKLDLYLPIRAVASTDLKRFDPRGVVFNPELAYRHRAFGQPDLALAAYLGVTYASELLMDYFYTVEKKDERTDRPTYNASAGEVATNLSFYLVKELPHKVTIFSGCSWNFYSNAENRMGPLMRDRETASYSLGVVWRYYESDEREGGTDAIISRN